MTTQVVPVLHTLTSLPSPIIFTPAQPFKCSHILLWFSKEPVIKQVHIGNVEQLAVPNVPGNMLKAPATLGVITTWFKRGLLSQFLTVHGTHPLVLHTITPTKPITIEFEGAFDMIALFGAQIPDDPHIFSKVVKNWNTPIKIRYKDGN